MIVYGCRWLLAAGGGVALRVRRAGREADDERGRHNAIHLPQCLHPAGRAQPVSRRNTESQLREHNNLGNCCGGDTPDAFAEDVGKDDTER